MRQHTMLYQKSGVPLRANTNKLLHAKTRVKAFFIIHSLILVAEKIKMIFSM
jgi:hypothetical protein